MIKITLLALCLLLIPFHSFAGTFCYPEDHGAIVNDNTDDYSAIADCVSEGNIIVFSPGVYNSSKEISFTGSSIQFLGNNTTIKFGNTNGLVVNSNCYSGNIIIKGLTLLTTNTDSNSPKVGISCVTSSYGSKGPTIEDVVLAGSNCSFWNYGIWLNNVWYSNINRTLIHGASSNNKLASCGIFVDGDYDSASLNITNSYILYYNCGLDIGGKFEGTVLDNTVIVGGIRGIFFHPSETGEPQLSISNSHVNVEGYGLDVSNGFWCTVSNSSILVNRDKFTNPTAVLFRETIQGFSGQHSLQGNIIGVYGSGGEAGFGIILFSTHISLIGNTVCHETQTGSIPIWIQSEYNSVIGNIIINGNIMNFGGDTNQIIGNVIRCP